MSSSSESESAEDDRHRRGRSRKRPKGPSETPASIGDEIKSIRSQVLSLTIEYQIGALKRQLREQSASESVESGYENVVPSSIPYNHRCPAPHTEYTFRRMRRRRASRPVPASSAEKLEAENLVRCHASLYRQQQMDAITKRRYADAENMDIQAGKGVDLQVDPDLVERTNSKENGWWSWRVVLMLIITLGVYALPEVIYLYCMYKIGKYVAPIVRKIVAAIWRNGKLCSWCLFEGVVHVCYLILKVLEVVIMTVIFLIVGGKWITENAVEFCKRIKFREKVKCIVASVVRLRVSLSVKLNMMKRSADKMHQIIVSRMSMVSVIVARYSTCSSCTKNFGCFINVMVDVLKIEWNSSRIVKWFADGSFRKLLTVDDKEADVYSGIRQTTVNFPWFCGWYPQGKAEVKQNTESSVKDHLHRRKRQANPISEKKSGVPDVESDNDVPPTLETVNARQRNDGATTSQAHNHKVSTHGTGESEVIDAAISDDGMRLLKPTDSSEQRMKYEDTSFSCGRKRKLQRFVSTGRGSVAAELVTEIPRGLDYSHSRHVDLKWKSTIKQCAQTTMFAGNFDMTIRLLMG